eukprot:9463187-Heterocapsa_arctica.AAC.1
MKTNWEKEKSNSLWKSKEHARRSSTTHTKHTYPRGHRLILCMNTVDTAERHLICWRKMPVYRYGLLRLTNSI